MPEPTGSLRPFLRLIAPHRRWMLLGLLLAGMAGGAGIGLLALSGWFVSAAALAGLTPLTVHLFNLFHPSVGIRIFAIVRTAARYGERIVNHDVTFRILENLRVWFYLRLEPLAPTRLRDYRSGDILDRIVADIDALDNLYIRVLSPVVAALVLTLAAAAVFRRFDQDAALILLIGMAAAGLALPMAADRAGRGPGKVLARHSAAMRIRMVEGVQGLAELLVFDAARRHQEAIVRCQDNLIRVQARMSHISGATSAGLTLLSGATVGMVLYWGAGHVQTGRLDGAVLAMLAFGTLAAFEVVWPLPAAFQYLSRTREAARRLMNIAEQAPAATFPETSPPPEDNALTFENVTFRYAPQEPDVLRNFSLKIGQGERVAVMGATGAGKSTLVHLLVRFGDPCKGSIRIGDRDLRTLSEDHLRSRMAVVSQQSHLFNATIRDNLRLACPEADDRMLWAALEAARLEAFVAALPTGLGTWIGASGHGLSGGEARRLAVAQAVLRKAPIWLLDEPTEGLDHTNEQALMKTILELTARRTLLLITHRPMGLPQLDRIAILEGGCILENGSHDALLAAGGRYAKLYHP